MTPQEIRATRLKHDYDEMVNLKGDIINFEIVRGTVPHIEEYKVIVNVRGILNKTPTYRDNHVLRITFPADYPTVPPEVYMISQPLLFHPNWFPSGKWCYGTWMKWEGIGHHLIRAVRTIQYDQEISNEKSPANADANTWYIKMKNSGLFPCDKQQLPDPTKKRFEVKKRFDIKK